MCVSGHAFMHVHLCIFVRLCETLATTCMWRPEDWRKISDLWPAAMYAKLAGPWASRHSHVFTSNFSIGALEFQILATCPTFCGLSASMDSGPLACTGKCFIYWATSSLRWHALHEQTSNKQIYTIVSTWNSTEQSKGWDMSPLSAVSVPIWHSLPPTCLPLTCFILEALLRTSANW